MVLDLTEYGKNYGFWDKIVLSLLSNQFDEGLHNHTKKKENGKYIAFKLHGPSFMYGGPCESQNIIMKPKNSKHR